MNKDGKWRFTSPTHVVLAFSKALDEILEEGGIAARSKRYSDNNRLLIQRMKEMGMETYIEDELSIHYPSGRSRSPSQGYFSH